MHTRHVRHDWQTWLDKQNQKSVRTLCGITSTPAKSGIPGITAQDLTVTDSQQRIVYGWCTGCVATALNIQEKMKDDVYTNYPASSLGPLYAGFWGIIHGVRKLGGVKAQPLYGGGVFWHPAR